MSLYPDIKQSNTALLIIDPVNSCAHEKCETPEWGIHFTKIRQMIPHLKDFVDKYRQQVGGTIIFTTITPWNKENLTPNINELYTDPRATYYSEDKTGFNEQFFVIKPEPTDLIFTKNTYDAFSDGKLTRELRSRGNSLSYCYRNFYRWLCFGFDC